MKPNKPNIKILVCYHKKDKLFKNDILVPIHCGRAVAMEESKDGKISPSDYKWLLNNMIGDDTGDNISHLNRDFNEWTAIYWAWKNYDKLGNPDYIGLSHYRRLFDFSQYTNYKGKNFLNKLGLNRKTLEIVLKDNDFIVQKGFNAHDPEFWNFDRWQEFFQFSESNEPELYKYYKQFSKEHIYYINNMFIMKKEDFFNYCEMFERLYTQLPEAKDVAEDDRYQRKFVDWFKKYNPKLLDETGKAKYLKRFHSFGFEYISSFFYMSLMDKYKNSYKEIPCKFIENKKEKITMKTLLKSILSTQNYYQNNIKRKRLTILGVNITFKCKNKQLIADKRKRRCVEITTNMGCSNNCVYCPQSLLLNTYYKNNKNRKSYLSMDDFKKIITNTPKDLTINFGGMSEPFENNDCIEMILYAYAQNRPIRVNTTLKRITLDQLKQIAHIPFTCFCIHTPDVDRLQNQEVTDDYLEKVKFTKNFNNVEYMVIGEPDKRINEILDNTLKTSTIILRGNNLDRSTIPAHIPVRQEEVSYKKNPLICSRVLQTYQEKPTKYDWPVLLPDGTLLLCCIDYGMKHQLGNLIENKYTTIMNNDVVKRIEDSMMNKNNDYLLCRECEWAIEWDEKKWKNFQKTGKYCQ